MKMWLISLTVVVAVLSTTHAQAPTTTTPAPAPQVPAATCSQALDVVFAVDASGSVRRGLAKKMLEVSRLVVNALTTDGEDSDPGVSRVGLELFASEPAARFQLNQFRSKESILAKIVGARFSRGSTNTGSAIKYALRNMFTSSKGDRSTVSNYLVMLVGGSPNSKSKTERAANAARARGLTIMTVGVGADVDVEDLKLISSESNIFMLTDSDDPQTVANQLINALCSGAPPPQPATTTTPAPAANPTTPATVAVAPNPTPTTTPAPGPPTTPHTPVNPPTTTPIPSP